MRYNWENHYLVIIFKERERINCKEITNLISENEIPNIKFIGKNYFNISLAKKIYFLIKDIQKIINNPNIILEGDIDYIEEHNDNKYVSGILENINTIIDKGELYEV